MTAVPGLTAVTRPEVFTFATPSSEEYHTTDLLSVVVGRTVAVRVTYLPTCRDAVSRERVMDSGCCFTVTVKVPYWPEPSAARAVMTASPFDTPETTPLASTEALSARLEDQVTP